MTVAELKKMIIDEQIPDNAEIAFWGNGDGSYFQNTDDVVYHKEDNTLCIGY